MDFIFDIDGTIANCDHRLHYVHNKPKKWKSFFDEMVNDTPIEPTVKVLNLILSSVGNRVIFCTGRPDNYRIHTENWLSKYAPFNKHIDRLYMRHEKDNRPDHIVKKQLLDMMRADGYNPVAVFDDRESVCDMWIENGLWLFNCGQRNSKFASRD